MPDPVKQLSGTVTLQAVAEQSNATTKVANAVLNMDWSEGDDWDVVVSDANIKLVHPKTSDDGGGLGPVVFAGTASGAVAYFLVNCDGTAYSSAPSGFPIANPP